MEYPGSSLGSEFPYPRSLKILAYIEQARSAPRLSRVLAQRCTFIVRALVIAPLKSRHGRFAGKREHSLLVAPSFSLPTLQVISHDKVVKSESV
jgi:hypothetical protein